MIAWKLLICSLATYNVPSELGRESIVQSALLRSKTPATVSRQAEISFTFDPNGDRYIHLTAKVNGVLVSAILDTGATHSWLRNDVWKRVLLAGKMKPSGNAINAVIDLGGTRRKESFYKLDAPNAPEALIGASFFLAASSTNKSATSSAARVTLDFDKRKMYVDWNPGTEKFIAKTDSVQAPMTWNPQLTLFVVRAFLPELGNVDFVVDTGSPVVYLSENEFKKATKLSRGPETVTITLGSKGVRAEAHPNYYRAHDYGVPILGNSLLSQFRVTIDYAAKMLYLEPR